MVKTLSKTKASKVKGKVDNSEKTTTEQNIAKPQAYKEYPRSYRFDSEIMHKLNTTLEKVNKVSPKKISANRLLKALIFISTELNEDKLLKAVKEVW